jgi:mannitol/fructose-specific phosphotransferase system IIA component (Ntr-type)
LSALGVSYDRSGHGHQRISLAERYSHRHARVRQARLLQELSRRAAASLDLHPERIVAEILKREELGSTGTGGGVAIPHARIQGLNKSFGILARLN